MLKQKVVVIYLANRRRGDMKVVRVPNQPLRDAIQAAKALYDGAYSYYGHAYEEIDCDYKQSM